MPLNHPLLVTILTRCRASPPCPSSPFAACVGAIRYSSSGSRWKQRQGRDPFAKEARVQGLKSRAAFKLLEMDAKYRLFRAGQTVVDLGFAPGSWSQVAKERTRPKGRIIGIDLLPAQPPRGVATFQGDFLSPVVQQLVKQFVMEPLPERKPSQLEDDESEDELVDRPSYIDAERHLTHSDAAQTEGSSSSGHVDVVLSDMSAPWEQTSGFYAKTLSNPYRRLMNTSGVAFRDHAGSMDLCAAALQFASDMLRPGGHFVCKFYQGSEDKALEMRLKKLFGKVHREKPDSSRSESKEAYFVALKRKAGVILEEPSGQ